MRETLRATEVLVKEGFEPMVYCVDDPIAAKQLEEAGAVAIMPLGAPIGSGLGIQNRVTIRLIVEGASVPVLVDAGVGTASDAAVAMELGCDGVLMNTAIAEAKDPVLMARAMKARGRGGPAGLSRRAHGQAPLCRSFEPVGGSYLRGITDMPRLLCCVVALALSPIPTSSASAAETPIADKVLGPEGPLFVDGKLYYVAWNPGSLLVWDGKTSKVINDAPGCSHNGLALTPRRTLLLACSDAHGAIVELDLSGRELRRWQADDRGRGFDGGINDIVVTANGGAYATVFGPFAEKPTAIVGRILYMAADSDRWTEVADDLNYANGVAVSPDQKTLYLDEMGSNSVISFAIAPNGQLSNRANFVRLDVLIPAKARKWWAGPDSLKVDSKGDLYVAQFYGGRILKISPGGKLLHVFDIAAGNGTTNLAFGPGEKDLYVSVVSNADDLAGKAEGSIVRIPNVAQRQR